MLIKFIPPTKNNSQEFFTKALEAIQNLLLRENLDKSNTVTRTEEWL